MGKSDDGCPADTKRDKTKRYLLNCWVFRELFPRILKGKLKGRYCVFSISAILYLNQVTVMLSCYKNAISKMS